MISLLRIFSCCLAAVVWLNSTTAVFSQPVNADPLGGVPPAVNLPPLKPGGEWVTLCKVAIPDDLIVIFRIHGGERCFRDGKRIETKDLPGDRSWQCLVTNGEGKEPIEIARLRIEKKELQFAWSEGAATLSDAEMLRNTAGELVAARTNRLVAFRTPQQGTPLELSFKEPTAVYYEIPHMPRLDGVLVEIDMQFAGSQGAGNWRLLGKGPALKPHDDRWFAESLRPAQWAVKIESSYGKSLKISATPVFWVASRNQLQPLTAKNLIAAINRLNAYEAQLAARHQQLVASTPKIKVKKKGKKGKAQYKPGPNPQADAAGRELAGVRGSRGNLQTLLQFVNANQAGSVHFRVSQDFNGFLLPVLTTR